MPSRCYSTQYVPRWQRSELIQVAVDMFEERQRNKMRITISGKSIPASERELCTSLSMRSFLFCCQIVVVNLVMRG